MLANVIIFQTYSLLKCSMDDITLVIKEDRYFSSVIETFKFQFLYRN
jgi:hypothetical protein